MSERWEGLALVLSSADSNSDRILRVLTEDDRLVAAVARHARRGGKRGPSQVQALSLVELALTERPGDELARLTRATTEHPFEILKGDLRRFALASSMAEVVLTLMQDFGREEGRFGLVLRAWSSLDDPSRQPVEELLLLFELRSLAMSGVMPPPDGLDDLSEAARATLRDWLDGRWRRLKPADRGPVGRTLEGLIAEASGSRGLKSRAFLDRMLALESA